MGVVEKLHQKIFGHPFVYDRIRPLVLGGIDYTPLYGSLDVGPDSVVLDLGCGTGNALEYLTSYRRYVGIDTDPVAIAAARRRYGERRDVAFLAKECTRADLDAVDPTHVVLAGVLHHLADADAVSLLGLVASAPRLRRVGTLDIVFVPGAPLNNLLARLDRGRFCRASHGYVELAERAGFAVSSSSLVGNRADGGFVRYWVMMLER